jgi:hypothetical protein
VITGTTDRCGPCLYREFEAHYRSCSICTTAPTANAFCYVGAGLLDAALENAGLEPDPDQRWRHETGRDSKGWLPDERRRFDLWRSLTPQPARREAVIDLSLDLARVEGNVWPASIKERRITASRLLFCRWQIDERRLTP